MNEMVYRESNENEYLVSRQIPARWNIFIVNNVNIIIRFVNKNLATLRRKILERLYPFSNISALFYIVNC